MIPFSPVPPVVPAGRMARAPQPVLGLTGGLELRPWRSEDADVLVAASQDPAIRLWNRLVVESTEHARLRIERMRKRWESEEAAIWAVAPVDGGAAVGLIGWVDVSLEEGSAEVVYWVLPEARQGSGGRGSKTRQPVGT
ncbi:GNAT family N-acetyltransferase [Streptomyces sp. V3I7]|uniref:GNAT family N-acetyltransferase n=1 Tax=Streptomyces sp. V3I7 TaxID=3042278 RepID=UPI00277F5034|nr:GNAT family N-acetyltransferase [Streptomyces sp. V3I7]MDQ0994670.1 RimJ/RimL family protein N-acetyltransferase [Streptomyces sp. V3I7]